MSPLHHATVLSVLLVGAASQAAPDEVRQVFDAARIEFDPDQADDGRVLVTSVELPARPVDQRDARRITATVTVRSVPTGSGATKRPGDVWARPGSFSVVALDAHGGRIDVELIRFTTGYGRGATFTQDVTALAPLLAGRRDLSLSISTYRKPAWEVSARLVFSDEGVGYRRPAFAAPLFAETAVTAENPRLTATIVIPPGLTRPRVRILSTGHSTDGGPENEFVTCTHLLSVDGHGIVSWRPWSERGADLREANPWAGRRTIDGREVWTSDLDRSGWQPGLVVEPLLVPLPELTPGPHEITLEVLGIRPDDRDHAHGFWRISGVVLADKPWPHVAGEGR